MALLPVAECVGVCSAMKKQPDRLEPLVRVAPKICSTSILSQQMVCLHL